MARVQLSSRAQADLASIADYIASDNLNAALRWTDGIGRTFELLANHPLLGEDVSTMQLRTRRQIFGNYLIFYRPTDAGIVVIRVLHGARKVEDLCD